jgi:hypothetical protein
METDSIDPIAIVEINVKGSRYLDGVCHVSVPYSQLLGETGTGFSRMIKYFSRIIKHYRFRKAIKRVASQLGASYVRDNHNTHELYFTLPSSTTRKIEAEVDKRKAEIIAPIVNPGSPKAFINDLYAVFVRTV